MKKNIVVKYNEEEMKELIKKYDGKIITTLKDKKGDDLEIVGGHYVLLNTGDVFTIDNVYKEVMYSKLTAKYSTNCHRKFYTIPYKNKNKKGVLIEDTKSYRSVRIYDLFKDHYPYLDLNDTKIKEIVFTEESIELIKNKDFNFHTFNYKRSKFTENKKVNTKTSNTNVKHVVDATNHNYTPKYNILEVIPMLNSGKFGKEYLCSDGVTKYKIVDGVYLLTDTYDHKNKKYNKQARYKIIYNDDPNQYNWIASGSPTKISYLYAKDEQGFYQTYIPEDHSEYHRKSISQITHTRLKQIKNRGGYGYLLKKSNKEYITEEWFNILYLQEFLNVHCKYSDINLYPRTNSKHKYLLSPENCYGCQVGIQAILDYILQNKLYWMSAKEFKLGKNLHERLQKIYTGEHGWDAFVLINLEFINLLYVYMDDLDLSPYSIQQIKDEIIEYSEKVYGKKYYSEKLEFNYYAENFNVFVDNARIAFKDEIEKAIKKIVVKRKGMMIDEK